MKRKILIVLALLIFTAVLPAQDTKSPTSAMLYSTVFPGGGQLYNHQYVKAGIIIGVQGYLVGSAIYHDQERDKYADKARDAAGTALQSYYEAKKVDSYEQLRNDYWWIGITAVLSVADAFVDAHLYNFDAEKNKVHLRFEDKKLQLQMRF
ncbi:MAG: hypothetical protein CVU48_01755 [Candidatus Cloacimonetes bacterium HGW-Cloacimonetes-1]|jgi:hypothetical protein|nr:MAG: hypothetical protein CVU48_01755 [Candidatus Cloacimonetes bacterium HGW-Cloacimonetes-1]